MILRSLSLLTNIGLKKEQEFWQNGVYSFKSFLNQISQTHSATWLKHWEKQINLINEKVKTSNFKDLLESIPNKLHYRLLPNLHKELVFFDAEMHKLYEKKEIFMATCLYKNEIHSFYQGKNLQDLKEFLKNKPYIVTFGGTKNDIPLLYENFKEKPFLLHIDLKLLCNNIKLKGGLKSVENQIGLTRKYCADMSGSDAPLYWDSFLKTKNKKILENLLHYNAEDVIYQPAILKHCWEHLIPNNFNNYQDCLLSFKKNENPYKFHS